MGKSGYILTGPEDRWIEAVGADEGAIRCWLDLTDATQLLAFDGDENYGQLLAKETKGIVAWQEAFGEEPPAGVDPVQWEEYRRRALKRVRVDPTKYIARVFDIDPAKADELLASLIMVCELRDAEFPSEVSLVSILNGASYQMWFEFSRDTINAMHEWVGGRHRMIIHSILDYYETREHALASA